MSSESRLSFVSSLLAAMTQYMRALWYHGAWERKNSQAGLLARSCFSCSRLKRALFRCSYEQMLDFSSLRAAKALRPAGCIRPCFVSFRTRLILMELQVLVGLRGVKRIV